MEGTAEAEATGMAQRLAPWSVILLLFAALAFGGAVVMDLWPMAVGAGAFGLGGIIILVWTARASSRHQF
ncbi:MAG: hypothetical protein ABR562_06475 [Thermoplasmatota archaeon]